VLHDSLLNSSQHEQRSFRIPQKTNLNFPEENKTVHRGANSWNRELTPDQPAMTPFPSIRENSVIIDLNFLDPIASYKNLYETVTLPHKGN